MAIPTLALIFMGGLALLATIGLFYDFDDPWTGVLVAFAAAILWGIFGMSSFDVIVATTTSTPLETRSDTIMPLVIIGLGLAFITFVFAVYDLIHALGSETRGADDMDLIG